MTRLHLVVPALALLAAASPVIAQDKPVPEPAMAPASDPLHEAFAAMEKAQGEFQAVMMSSDKERKKAASAAMPVAQAAFAKLFKAANWDALDAKADAELLKSGLLMTANDALAEHDGKTAVRAVETFLAKLGDVCEAKFVRIRMQPSAYLAAGDLAKAMAAVAKNAADADAAGRGNAQVTLGDFRCASGDVEGARKAWTEAIAGRASKAAAEQRLALVGGAAPEIDAKTWIDGEAKPLSALKGKVVLVDFWASWCPPCRQVMPGLDALYRRHKDEGFVVLGVTRHYPNLPGFLPRAGTKDPMREGEIVEGLTPETLLEHLRQFRANIGISYPFAVTAGQAEADAYKVTGTPTMALVDREGKVVFVKVGSDDEDLVAIAVERALAAK